MKIVVGAHNVSSQFDTKYKAKYDIETVRVHEYYDKNSDSQHYDIALVQTTLTIKYSRGVSPVCLPPTTWNAVNFFDGKSLQAAGWGTLQ